MQLGLMSTQILADEKISKMLFVVLGSKSSKILLSVALLPLHQTALVANIAVTGKKVMVKLLYFLVTNAFSLVQPILEDSK